FIASVLVAITCAVAGTFVVLRGLAFIGDALSHGVLPGIATAMLLSISPIIGAAVGAAVIMGGVGLVSRRYKVSADTAIGLMFVAMLSLGVIITSRSTNLEEDLDHILFGDSLAVHSTDLVWQIIALLLVCLIGFIARRPFLMMSVDDGLAQTSGFSVSLFHNLLLAMIGLTVISSFQTVGTLLVMGMLVAPAASAVMFARRISSMMLIASLIGIFASYLGLLISHHFNLAASATIVLTTVLIFAICAVRFDLMKRRNLKIDELPHQHEHNHAH
ncbi:MAG: metal ABC transporter permease, partial [Actinobacteria bacterium]|nr:metal ABC transporter permease [Actinomycetota bacterium]